MNRNYFFWVVLLSIAQYGILPAKDFTLEHPKTTSNILVSTIEVQQIPSTDVENTRLRQIQKKFDHVLTGFYLPSGATLRLNVTTLSLAANNERPAVVIGTRVKDGGNVTEIPLSPGPNIITPAQHNGGIIYLRYVSNQTNPTGKARVSFLNVNSGHVPHPYYILGKTTTEEFRQQVESFPYNDVVFTNQNAIVVVNKASAEKFSLTNYNNRPHTIDGWLKALERIFDAQRNISGLNSNDSNPLHKPLHSIHKYMMVEASYGYMFATHWASGYNGSAALERLLTQYQIENNPWGISHELGHQNQQSVYKPTEYTETTVNLYSMAVMRSLFGESWQRWNQSVWDKVHNDWFMRPDDQRRYWSSDIATLYQNVNEGRLMFLAQLQYIFGDELTQLLHRITREEEKNDGSNDERKFYLLYKIMEISGYDLRDLYNKWGISFIPAEYVEKLNQLVLKKNLPKPPYNSQIHLVTPFSVPDPNMKYPLPLIGIKSSSPEASDNSTSTGKLELFPNPAKEVINIQLSNIQQGTVRIYNALGNPVRTVNINEKSTGPLSIDIRNLPQGIYTVSIESGINKLTSRFIKTL